MKRVKINKHPTVNKPARHRAYDLRCEYLVNPLGMDEPHPRFSWKMKDKRRGAKQTAYRFQAKTGGTTAWDTGKVRGSGAIRIPYAGKRLKPCTRYTWRVMIWDADHHESAWSKWAWFETGLMKQENWKAKWIQTGRIGKKNEPLPVSFFRKEFDVPAQIARARVFVSALGLYELHLNGARVGKDYFTPGWTQYDKRVQYQAYDVTGMIRPGKNMLGAMLGDGWFRGRLCSMRGYEPSFGNDRPRLLVQLMLDYADGTTGTVVSNGQWEWRIGHIALSDIYLGETQDLRRVPKGWNLPGKLKNGWTKVRSFPWPPIQVSWSCGPRVRAMQVLAPKSISKAGKDRWIINMGQNMVGWVRLKVSGKRGDRVVVRHAEMLNPDGSIYTQSLRSAKATATYIIRGDEKEILEPHFSFFGFQYVEISGLRPGPSAKDIEGVVLYSQMDRAGGFRCSSSLVNRLFRNIVWGQKGNYLDVPTDCPQRDERLGWTGDAQVFMRTAAYNMDVSAFFSKWLTDLNDAQKKDGSYPNIAPDIIPKDKSGSAGWANAGIICPWIQYQVYGDERILSRNYANMQRWMTWQSRQSKEWTRKPWGFGDWLSIQADTPKDLIAMAFFAHDSDLMSRIASVLGKTADAKKWRKQYERICRVFVNEFVTPDGKIAGQTQTAAILALQFGLVKGRRAGQLVDFLVRDIEARGGHLSTGFLGTPYLNHVLTSRGHSELAYQLLLNRTWPSWLYPVTKGATTVWERWDGWTEENGFQDPAMNSFNHYAYGAIGEWLFGCVGGIRPDPAFPGYKRFIIAPTPPPGRDGNGDRVTWAKVSHQSPYGAIKSKWKRNGHGLSIFAEVPANTSAQFRIPVPPKAKVELNGVTISRSKQVSGIAHIGDRVVCRGAAGEYRFEVG